MNANTACDVSYVISLWLIDAVLWEQYGVVRQPDLVSRMDPLDGGVRAVLFVVFLCLLGDMAHFFKFVRRDLLFGFKSLQQKVVK